MPAASSRGRKRYGPFVSPPQRRKLILSDDFDVVRCNQWCRQLKKQEIAPFVPCAHPCGVTLSLVLQPPISSSAASRAISKDEVYAELADRPAGRKFGRMSEDELVIFDSSGSGVQDVATAWSYRGSWNWHRRAIRFAGSCDGTVNMGEVADAYLPARLAARLPDRWLGSSFHSTFEFHGAIYA